jgi:hypothetical protein
MDSMAGKESGEETGGEEVGSTIPSYSNLFQGAKGCKPWSFGSCHACWKEVRRNFDDPNLPVLGGCGCVICNRCVIE